MSKKIVGGLFGKAAGAARNPVGTAGQALGLAKGAVATGVTVAEGVAHVAAGRLRARQAKEVPRVEVSLDATEQSSGATERPGDASATAKPAEPAEKAAGAAKKASGAAKKGSGTAKKGGGAAKGTGAAKKAGGATKKAGAAKKPTARSDREAVPEPQVVMAEPAPPAEPPVDIVEQVLAAEEEPLRGHATEPKAGSRDESHGDAAMQRSEFDEIAEEQAEALPGGDVDIETPVGTTGADVGRNPDTAEADLQQPATEPLVDPSTTKAVKTETETGSNAARNRKG